MTNDRFEIVEYKVRIIAKSAVHAERILHDALGDKMGAVWCRTDTPIRVLGEK